MTNDECRMKRGRRTVRKHLVRRSALGIRHSRRGLGLIELLTLLAVLVIALGMVVVTARHVRSNSATELTRKRMHALVDVTAALISHGVDPTLPLPIAPTTAVGASGPPTPVPISREQQFADFAVRSSRQLATQLSSAPIVAGGAKGAIVDFGVGVGVVGPPEMVDAWERPIALISQPDAAIGMAPDDGPFFVSAGPDGRFLTLADNIYSYDLPALLPRVGGDRGTADKRLASRENPPQGETGSQVKP